MAKVERCPHCRRRMTRSTEANRRYWALLHVMAEKLHPLDDSGVPQTFGAETWHLWAKTKFLGCDDVRLPSGRVIVIPHSTAELDVSDFSDYMTKVEAFANEHDAYLEDGVFG